MQQHGCPLTHLPPTLSMRSVGQNSTFSEHGHVAYLIKENQECSIMVANILPTDPLLTLGMGAVGIKIRFFRTWSCCISN